MGNANAAQRDDEHALLLPRNELRAALIDHQHEPSVSLSHSHSQQSQSRSLTGLEDEDEIKVNDRAQPIQLLLVGDRGTGKASLLRRFTDRTFTASLNGGGLVSVDGKKGQHDLVIDGQRVLVQVLDTTGPQRSNSTSSNGVLLVYDVTNAQSFASIRRYIRDTDHVTDRLLIGNKCDLVSDRVIDSRTAQSLADEHQLLFIETSAMANTNVTEAFKMIAANVRQRPQYHRYQQSSLSLSQPLGRRHHFALTDNEFLIDVNDNQPPTRQSNRHTSTNTIVSTRNPRRRPSIVNGTPYQTLAPIDVFLTVFAYLDQRDIVRSSRVSHRWTTVAYDSSLWSTIHLCSIYQRVDDLCISLMLGRFPLLQSLCLDRCSAITDKTLLYVAQACRQLQCLSLIDCNQLSTHYVIAVIDYMTTLRKVELLGVTNNHSRIIEHFLVKQRRVIDLGMFLVEWQVKTGLRVVGYKPFALSSVAPYHSGDRRDSLSVIDAHTDSETSIRLVRGQCRHNPANNRNARPVNATACWGSISGHAVLSSQFYHLSGNYPTTACYSCQQHNEADFSDAVYKRCVNCEALFLSEAMYDEMICVHCFDIENLLRKSNWITLSVSSIRAFGFSEIIGKTIRIADKKNLPASLQKFATTECRLDYSLPGAASGGGGAGGGNDSDEKSGDVSDESQPLLPSDSSAESRPHHRAIDPHRVPITAFLTTNAVRLDRTVDSIKTHLRSALKAGATRALLVLNASEDIEVYADHRIITDGLEGSQYLEIVVQLWSSARSFIFAITGLLLLASVYAPLLHTVFHPPDQTYVHGIVNPNLFLVEPEPEIDWFVLLATLSFFFFIGAILLLLWWRLRRWFDVLFKKFLACDIFAIYLFGCLVAMVCSLSALLIPFDWLTLMLVGTNVAGVCVYALYHDIGFVGQTDGDNDTDDLVGDGNEEANAVVVPTAQRAPPRLPEPQPPQPPAANPNNADVNDDNANPNDNANNNPPPAANADNANAAHADSSHLHRFSIVLMNATMIILLAGTMPYWVAMILVFIFALLDLASQIRPQSLRFLPPVLIPSTMIIPNKPMILFSVNRVYFRPAELMCYAATATVIQRFDVTLVVGLLGILTLCVLVMPFVSSHRRWRRPLVFLVLWSCWLWWREDDQLTSVQYVFNHLPVY